MVQILHRIPQKDPVVHKLQGKVQRTGWNYTIGDVQLPTGLTNKLKKRCKSYQSIQDAVSEKDLYLRGRETSNGVDWFALTTDKFKPIPVQEISDIFDEVSDDCVVRYSPGQERFQLNYKIGEGPQKMSLLVDSGDFGTYGGNAENAVKVGLSMFDGVCTNWTLFLGKSKLYDGRAIHRNDEPDLRDIINAQFEFANVVQGKWDESKDIKYTKEVVEAYAEAYTRHSGQKKFFARVLDGIEDTIPGYELAFRMTQEAQQLSDRSRVRMEMLAGELILCPEQIERWYGY